MRRRPKAVAISLPRIDAGKPNLDYEVGHIKDNHHYRPPTAPYVTEKRAAVNGEYGAIGYLLDGHVWDDD